MLAINKGEKEKTKKIDMGHRLAGSQLVLQPNRLDQTNQVNMC